MPRTGLLVVDVQNDFCEGGSLAVTGGAAGAAAISEWLRRNDYAIVVASRDLHDPAGDNGGHFGSPPDFASTWPPHCVAGTPGADYHPALDTARIATHVTKGHGRPAYSAFEGTDAAGRPLEALLRDAGVTAVDVCGIASDYCVRQTALSALDAGLRVRVLTDLCAGVAPETTAAAYAELRDRGATLATTTELAGGPQ